MTQPNYELLKDAYAIIGGIPDKVIDLHAIVSKRSGNLACGTVCCAAGWLAMHPTFKAMGLDVSPGAYGSIILNGDMETRNWGGYARQMAVVFGISTDESMDLFDSRQPSEWKDDWAKLTDKQVWLRRVREFLEAKGQL